MSPDMNRSKTRPVTTIAAPDVVIGSYVPLKILAFTDKFLAQFQLEQVDMLALVQMFMHERVAFTLVPPNSVQASCPLDA